MPARRRLIPLALAVIMGLSACGRPGAGGTAEPASPALPVRTARAQQATATRTQDAAGTLRPFAHAVVASRIMGKVAQADFAIGQPVATGEVLVTLDAEELTARLAQADAALDQAKRDYERESGLLAKGVASAESVRALADRLRIADAATKEARTLRGYTVVAAPFAGHVTRKLVNAGDLAVPGTPLFEIEGTSDLRAEVEVPGSLPLLAVGATLRVRLPGGVTVAGTLVEFSSAADPLTRTRLAKISLPADSGARSGDFVRVAWPAGEMAGITVPADAVSVMGQMERVFVVQDGRARLRLVKTNGFTDGLALIAAGLDAGETVVLAPPASLHDGQTVETTP